MDRATELSRIKAQSTILDISDAANVTKRVWIIFHFCTSFDAQASLNSLPLLDNVCNSEIRSQVSKILCYRGITHHEKLFGHWRLVRSRCLSVGATSPRLTGDRIEEYVTACYSAFSLSSNPGALRHWIKQLNPCVEACKMNTPN